MDLAGEEANHSKLSREHLEEIKRVFAICDTDGNHKLDHGEIKMLLTSLANGQEPDDNEVRLLIMKIDKDNDMMVSYEEFEAGIAEWLSESHGEECGTQTLPGQETNSPLRFRRRNIHNEISQFFTQFRPRQGIDIKDLVEDDSDDEDLSQSRIITDEMPPEQKLEHLHYCQGGLDQFPTLVEGLRSTDPEACTVSVQTLVQMLQITEIFSSASQRYMIAPLLIQLFECVTHAQIPERLIQIIADTEAPEDLRQYACRALALYVRGPRMAHTPTDNPWHPAAFLAKRVAVQGGCLAPLVALLSHPTPLLKVRAAEALGAVGETNLEGLQVLLEFGVREMLLPLVRTDLPVDQLKITSASLAIMVGHTQQPGVSGLDQLPWELMLPILEALSALLNQVEDEEVLANTCAALAHVLPLVNAEESLGELLLQKILGLLQLNLNEFYGAPLPDEISFARMHAILSVMTCLRGCITPEGSGGLTSQVEVKLFELLIVCLEGSYQDLRVEALLMLEEFLKKGRGPDLLMGRPPLVARLLSLIQSDEVLAGRTIRLIRLLTEFTEAHPQQLLHHHTISVLFQFIRQLKRHDDVLAEVYHFTGPSFYIRRVQNGMLCLVKLLDAEQKLKKKGEKVQTSLLKDFGMNSVSCIQELIDVMLEEVANGHFLPWLPSINDITLDKSIEVLLRNMKKAHQASEHTSSTMIVVAIDELIQKTKNKLAEIVRSNNRMDDSSPSVKNTLQRQSSFLAPAFREIMHQGVEASHVIPTLTKNMSLWSSAITKDETSHLDQLPPADIDFSRNESSLPDLMRDESMQQNRASDVTAPPPAEPNYHIKLVITGLNFDKMIRLQVPANIDYRELIRHCTVVAGRSIDLGYMGNEANILPINSQQSLAAAFSRKMGKAFCTMYMNAQITEEFVASVVAGDQKIPEIDRLSRDFDNIMVPNSPKLSKDEAVDNKGLQLRRWHTEIPKVIRVSSFSEQRSLSNPPYHQSVSAQMQRAEAKSAAFAEIVPPPIQTVDPCPEGSRDMPPPPPPGRFGKAASFMNVSDKGLSEKKKKLEKLTRSFNAKYKVDMSSFELARALKIFNKLKTQSLDEQQFCLAMAAEGVSDPAAQHQAFNAFDCNGDGQITIKEFLIGLSIMRRGSMEDRLKLAFHAFDLDGNGVMDQNELTNLIATTLGLGTIEAHSRAQVIFQSCNFGQQGHLDYEQFKAAVLRDQSLLNSFWTQGMSTPQAQI